MLLLPIAHEVNHEFSFHGLKDFGNCCFISFSSFYKWGSYTAPPPVSFCVANPVLDWILPFPIAHLNYASSGRLALSMLSKQATTHHLPYDSVKTPVICFILFTIMSNSLSLSWFSFCLLFSVDWTVSSTNIYFLSITECPGSNSIPTAQMFKTIC